MLFSLLADLVVLLHLAFVVFALLGGLLALRWKRIVWVHLPAAAWAAAVECGGWLCPLTPLENELRRLGHGGTGGGYETGFVEHYLLPILYPAALTRNLQLALGLVVLAVNLAVYGFLLRRAKPPSGKSGG